MKGRRESGTGRILETARRDTRRLQRLLTWVASRASDYRQALRVVLRRVCEAGDWAYGEAWAPLDRADLVLLEAVAPGDADYATFHEAGRRLRPTRHDADLPGRAWASRRHVWIEDLERADLPRRDKARVAGLRSAVALPCLSDRAVVAVFLLFAETRRASDPTTVDRLLTAVTNLGPVLERKKVEQELRHRALQQEVVARLGVRALAGRADLDPLLGEVVRAVAGTLDVEYCKILECTGDGLLLRAGTGWQPGLVGTLLLGRGTSSQGGITLAAREPVVVEDLETDARLDAPVHLRNHGVRSGVSVIIHASGRTWGVIGAHSRRRRKFRDHEIHFLQGVANVLGTAISRWEGDRELQAHRERLEELVEARTVKLEAYHEQLRQSERLSTIGTLAAGIGHDMNNVMLPALCRLDSLERADLPGSSARDLAAVRASLDHLLGLTQGLHLFTLDPSDPHASAPVTPLREWWEEVGSLMVKVLPAGVRFSWELPAGIPPLRIARHQLTQAVLNLVANAGEAIGGGNGEVELRAEEDPDTARVRVLVRDTGRGMNPEVLRHALEPLFTTKKRSLSTGMGLSLVYGIVRSAGGTVSIDSAPGKGTAVVLSIPAQTRRDRPADGSERLPRVARVDLEEARTFAFVSTLLRAARFEMGSRDAAALWVADALGADGDRVRSFLAGHRHRRVVLLGVPAAPGDAEGIVRVPDRADLDGLRKTLRGIVRDMMEVTDAH